MEFRKLKADEIDVKVGSVTKTGYTLLLYKNARVDMSILDETVGAENWQRDHKEVKGNLYCGIGINCMLAEYEDVLDVNGNTRGQKVVKTIDRWVWKWDCGVESAFGDKEKGEASDSFKRAGFNWGIGRELYTSPFIFVECETKYDETKKSYQIANIDDKKRVVGLKVSEITYTDKGEIDKLVIVDNKGIQIFPKNNYTNGNEDTKTTASEFVINFGKYKGQTIEKIYLNDDEYLDWLEDNTPLDIVRQKIKAFKGEKI